MYESGWPISCTLIARNWELSVPATNYMSVNDFEQNVLISLGRIEQKVDGLAGSEGRVTKLENAQRDHFWLSVAVVPIVGALHAIARKMGWDI